MCVVSEAEFPNREIYPISFDFSVCYAIVGCAVGAMQTFESRAGATDRDVYALHKQVEKAIDGDGQAQRHLGCGSCYFSVRIPSRTAEDTGALHEWCTAPC